MNTDKLLKLATFLETLNRERFHYGSWVGNGWKGKQDLSCGTTACALGWAVTLFPDELELRAFRTAAGVWLKGSSPFHARNSNLSAAMVVFDLTPDEAQFLFIPSGLKEVAASPAYVAAKIHHLVGGQKPDSWMGLDEYEHGEWT